MATPSERKALFFFGFVALLGAGVRGWKTFKPDAVGYSADTYNPEAESRPSLRSAKLSSSAAGKRRTKATTSRTGQINRDSESTVDVDRATMAELDALGVLPRGMARLIVADRDSFGPFGSMDEMRRIPFVSASTLRKLAPRVTFSRIPRPRNAVVQPHAAPSQQTPRARNVGGARP